MIRRRLIVASLLVAPSLALAQRGGGGRTQADRHKEMMDDKGTPSGPTLRVRDIEDQSPLKLLIDKRKDLKLADPQLAQLKDAEGKLKDKMAPLLKAVDSLLHELHPSMANPSSEERARLRNASDGMTAVLNDVRANYDASSKEALALLDADQQTKANELLAKQREEREKMIREKLSSGDRSGGGAPPPDGAR